MKRNTILGLLLLSVSVPALHRLVTGPRSEAKTIQSHRISEVIREAKAPKPSLAAGLPASVEAGTDLDRRNGDTEQIAQSEQSVSDAQLPAMCDSLVRGASEGTTELRQVVRGWAETNGPAAATWASQLPQGPNLRDVLTQVAVGWAATDLSGALDWAHTLSEDESKTTVIEQLGYETARTDAVKALKVAASLEPGGQRDDLIEHAISQWAVTDFAAAVQWAEAGVPDEDLRQRLLAAVAVAVAGQDGAAAATLAATTLAPGDEQDRVAVAVVQRWVQNDPEQAAAWVAQFPDTPARATTVQNLVAFWAAQDREAAANWLQALPEGTLRDAGMAAYSQSLASEIAAVE